MGAQRFRERPRPPAVIEARLFVWRDDADDLVDWVRGCGGSASFDGYVADQPVVHLYGEDGGCQRVYRGDWIIRHHGDQFSTMSADVFRRRYEPLPDAATAPPTGEADRP
ncbi:MAG: hypothetical protein AB7R89_13770 [Dehalococcoidia bacterium]